MLTREVKKLIINTWSGVAIHYNSSSKNVLLAPVVYDKPLPPASSAGVSGCVCEFARLQSSSLSICVLCSLLVLFSFLF